jgi:hypothetical protein
MITITLVCTGRDTHREKRLARGNAWEGIRGRANEGIRSSVRIYTGLSRAYMTYTLPPCPVHTCHRQPTWTHETWTRIYNEAADSLNHGDECPHRGA